MDVYGSVQQKTCGQHSSGMTLLEDQDTETKTLIAAN